MKNRKAVQQTSAPYPASDLFNSGRNGSVGRHSTFESESGGTVKLSEEQFYSLYSWCLNPVLTLEELFQRFREELERYRAVEIGWQREECKINLYLFACAIACTIDDCLGGNAADLSAVRGRLPDWALAVAQSSLQGIEWLRKLARDRAIRLWRSRWHACVEQACELLIRTPGTHQSLFSEFQSAALFLLSLPLPRRLAGSHMRLPESFRSGDMTHQDVLSLARLFECSALQPTPLVIIGLRTAGAYFAPLIATYFRTLGWPLVSWATLRPNNGIAPWEHRQIGKLLRGNPRVLLVTGDLDKGWNLRPLLRILQRCGVPPERITILGPRRANHTDQTSYLGIRPSDRISVITLGPGELYKESLLDPKSMEFLFQEYSAALGSQTASIIGKRSVDEINLRFSQGDGPEAGGHLKRVFAVHLSGPGSKSVVKNVFVKSTGWGWLGYHSYLAGARLNGLVPKILGLRDGLLLTDWIGEDCVKCESSAPEEMSKAIASYIAARVRRLPLSGDFWLDSRFYRWTGWDEMVEILRGAYGAGVSLLKKQALRSQLRRYMSPFPTLVDGSMAPHEWVRSGAVSRKTDFEHHNFGGSELDIVDPAYDLAAAVFEFSLPPAQEKELLQAYARESGDTGIGRRILLYKLLYGSMMMKRAADRIAAGSEGTNEREMHLVPDRTSEHLEHGERWNRRYQAARDFLVFQMNQFSAGLVPRPETPTWSKFLFFLDLDGVFDRELLGFPHTTWNGLKALALLQSHGYSVVLNAGRGIEQVRNYCQAFAIPGGLAEYGSVFFDAVRQCDISLLDPQAASQLARCREAIQKLPGVFIDPGYRYSIRAYRYHGRGTVGLSLPEVASLLSVSGFDKLTFILGAADTYILQKGGGKGPGMLAAKKFLGSGYVPTAAIGDSGEDVGMLQAVEFAYTPANCSLSVRQLAMQSRCRIMPHAFQHGLLDAVLDILPNGHKNCNGTGPELSRTLETPAGLVSVLLEMADRSLLARLVKPLHWRARCRNV